MIERIEIKQPPAIETETSGTIILMELLAKKKLFDKFNWLLRVDDEIDHKIQTQSWWSLDRVFVTLNSPSELALAKSLGLTPEGNTLVFVRKDTQNREVNSASAIIAVLTYIFGEQEVQPIQS